MRSQLRDLVARLQEVARSHMAFSQAADVIDNMANHLSARARVEEFNQAEGNIKMSDDFKFALGTRARDKVSKLTGIITSQTRFLNGCNRYGIEQPVDKDGKIPDVVAFDEARLEQVEGENFIDMGAESRQEARLPGGPRDLAPREE